MYICSRYKAAAFFALVCFFVAANAFAAEFKGASLIEGGAGGVKGQYGKNAYFENDGISLYAHNYEVLRQEKIASFPYIKTMHTGRSGRHYRGGAGGDIFFGDRAENYVFGGDLYLRGGKGGESDNTGVGANGGNIRMDAQNITVNGTLHIASGDGGFGAKGGNVYLEFARRLTVDNIDIYGGEAGANFGNSGNVNMKGFIARVKKDMKIVRTHNNMHIGLDMLIFDGDNAHVYIESDGPLGALRLEVGSIEVYGSALLDIVGTRTDTVLNTRTKIIENEVHVRNIRLASGSSLKIERSGGDFLLDSFEAAQGSSIDGYLPMKGKQMQFRFTDVNVKNGDRILTVNKPIDITGAKVSIWVCDKLKKLKKGQSVVLMNNVTGDIEPFELVADVHAAGKYIFEVLIRGRNLEARLL